MTRHLSVYVHWTGEGSPGQSGVTETENRLSQSALVKLASLVDLGFKRLKL